jgi:hypothetical protein
MLDQHLYHGSRLFAATQFDRAELVNISEVERWVFPSLPPLQQPLRLA